MGGGAAVLRKLGFEWEELDACTWTRSGPDTAAMAYMNRETVLTCPECLVLRDWCLENAP